MQVRSFMQLSLLAALGGREAVGLKLQPALRSRMTAEIPSVATSGDGIEEIFTPGAQRSRRAASRTHLGSGMRMPKLSSGQMKMLTGMLAASQLPGAMGQDCFMQPIYSSVSNFQSENLSLYVLAWVFAIAMAWGIGANDVANSFATSVGAKSLTLRQATIAASICEVEEKFGEQNFRVLSEMQILAKIEVAILDLVG